MSYADLSRWPQRITGIFRATRQHAVNLCKFVTAYKVLLLLQKKANGGKERDLDSLIAGGIGGWWVFGERNAVSFQVHEGLRADCCRSMSRWVPD
jgi:peroxisomal membrane protein 4